MLQCFYDWRSRRQDGLRFERDQLLYAFQKFFLPRDVIDERSRAVPAYRIWTEQGVYLDGYNGAEAPQMRKGGTIDMLNGLAAYLQRQARA